MQLIQEGRPFAKHPIGDAVVGLDIGPSTIAAVTSADAMLEPFCPTVKQPWKNCGLLSGLWTAAAGIPIRETTSRTERSKRGRSPGEDRNTTRPGRESARKSSAAWPPKESGRTESWQTAFAQGSTIRTEKIRYRSFQKNFGRSTKVRAAGMFVSMLSKKEDAGGGVIEFNTRTTKLSQFDHMSGNYVKKPLSQRQHTFADGTVIQRDLYSAFLARFVDRDKLDARSATDAFPAAKLLLQRAASSEVEPARGLRFIVPQVQKGLRAGRLLKRNSGPVEAKDVVAVAILAGESLGEIGHSAVSKPLGFSHGVV